MSSYDVSITSLKTFYFVLRYSQLTACDSFRWTAKGLSRAYTCIHSPPHSPPIQAATQR